MKKILFAILLLSIVSSASAATKTITLKSGLSSFSTPYELNSINFSSGSQLNFFTLSGGTWQAVNAVPTVIKPLEGFMIYNSSPMDASMTLDYNETAQKSFQKQLRAGWNLIGMNTIKDPFLNLSNVTGTIDFTRTAGGDNLSNTLNTSFDKRNDSALASAELWEAYAIYLNSPGTYSWNPADTLTNGNMSLGDYPLNSLLLLAGSKNQPLMSFKVSAVNDNITLKDIAFSGTNLSALSNIRIMDSNGNVLGTAISSGENNGTFENLDANPSNSTIPISTSRTFFVVADINNNTFLNGLQITLKISDSHIKGSNGRIISLNGPDISSSVHSVTRTIATVNKASNPDKEINTSALRFTVSASSNGNGVTVNSINLSSLLSGYTGATSVNIYKNSISQGTLAGSGNIGSNQNISLTSNNTIDAGSTATFIITVEGAVGDPNANSKDWSVVLNDVMIGSFSVKQYSNLGQLPISEVK